MKTGDVRSSTVRLVTGFAREAKKDRLVGLSAEVAFFLLLAIPPAILILAGAAGYVGGLFGADVVASMRRSIESGLGSFLSPETMETTIRPTVDQLFAQGRADILSLGAILAVWSVSRMTKVMIVAMNDVYDIEERRPAWRRRLLALGLTAGGFAALAAFLPLIVAGPRFGERLGLPSGLSLAWQILYWPGAIALGVATLATLYHVAPNHRTPWRHDLPGALFAAAAWVISALALRVYVAVAVDGSTFGALAVPVVMMLWLFVSALAVLAGGELNAELVRMRVERLAAPSDRETTGAEADRAR